MITRVRSAPRRLTRWVWFVGIWAASVAAWSLLAYLLHKLIPA
jgi:hypothetical protein